MRFGNLKIGLRLALGFGIILILMLAMIITAITEMKQINDKLDRIVRVNIEQQNKANEMLDAVHVISRVMHAIALLDDPEAEQIEKDRMTEAREQYNEAESRFAELVNSDEGREIFERTKQLKEITRPLNDHIVDMAMAGQQAEAVKLLFDESMPKVTEWRSVLRELNEYAGGRTDMRYKEAQESYRAACVIMYSAGVAGIILGMIISVSIARSVTKPVGELVTAAHAASSGDLTVNINSTSRDEVGVLSDAFRKMISQMREIISAIKDKSNTVAASSQQLNSSAQQTAASANETSATMTEISSSVEQVTANIQEIAGASETATEHANEGNKGILRVNEQMKNISNATDGVSKAIDGLNQKSQEINQIVELITSIADQTNLLALNAAIEAARAGEHGRGFAVVAEEVRKLAEQSANAAKEIYSLINVIQIDSQRAVDIMAEGGKEVAAGANIVSEAGDNFKEIINTVRDLTSQIHEVASATEQMSAGVQNVAAATEEQTATMEEVSASAEELSRISVDLNNLVNRFKVDKTVFIDESVIEQR